MNLLDLVLLAALSVSGFMGARLGLIYAVLLAVGGILSWYFAGGISASAGAAMSSLIDSPSLQAFIQVVLFVGLFAVMLYITSRLVRVLRVVFATVTFGMSAMADRGGGFLLGLLVGLMVISILVLAGARLTYQLDFDDLGEPVYAPLSPDTEEGDSVAEGLESLLAESFLARTITRVGTWLPGNGLGLAQQDFGDALDLLRRQFN